MSLKNQSITLARVEDLTLGAFAFVPESTALNQLVSIIGTAGGKDKFLAVAQYTLKIVARYLSWRAVLQHQAGRRPFPTSTVAPALTKFASLISDARILHDFTGLFATVRWLTSLERRQCTTRGLRTIERLQAWSILLYWPLEHITYLLGHGLMPAELSLASSVTASKPRGAMIKLDAGKLTRASMGLWGLYLGLQLINLYNDSKQVSAQERLLNKSKAISTAMERAKLRQRRKIIVCEVIAQLCNLPLAAHWCVFFLVMLGIGVMRSSFPVPQSKSNISGLSMCPSTQSGLPTASYLIWDACGPHLWELLLDTCALAVRALCVKKAQGF